MKLVDKLTLWLVGVVFLITPVSMIISYRSIKNNINTAEIARLQEVNNKVAEQLKTGIAPHKFMLDRPISIKKVSTMPSQAMVANNHAVYNKELKREECRLDVVSYYTINNTVYSISTYNYITRGELILKGMMRALFWKMLLITVFVAISARIISKFIFSSFNKTLKNIESFSLRQKQKISLPGTTTTEFKQLNSFLQKMTDIALEDYSRVKEFSENASHEVQTPLAVLRTKLELLTETCIGEDQAILIADMQNAIEKLAKINRSLLLLTKLDNFEFETTESIKFCKITKESYRSFENWIQARDITVTQNIDKNISLKIHPVLAEILVNNLLSNAIRYNVEGGTLDITLTKNELIVCNSGQPPETETELLFRRFKKSNQSADSIGLGLSIVKQICNVNNFKVTYSYGNGLHTLLVDFNGQQNADAQESEQIDTVFIENIVPA